MKGTWRDGEAPQTPLQRAVFMETCVKWLTKDITPQGGVFDTYTTFPRTVPPDAFPMTQTHQERLSGKCAFCGSSRGPEVVMANPFTPRCLVTVCEGCRRGASAT
tara:strand:+ start:1107 stop:1421 length:315 start_codon:yes stop_codon:yes gene_type:complete